MPTQITLARVPGFADLPDNLLEAEDFAIGLHLQRLLSNVKFGMVRPEFFLATYIHGQTVELPTSPVDGYQYTREELHYLWSYAWTGGTADGGSPVTGKGSIWYFGAKVDQTTGEVFSYIKYKESERKAGDFTNDGILAVVTIGIRQRTGMVLAAAPTWAAHQYVDADFYVDRPLHTSLLTDLNRKAKFAAINCEAIYMGEFVHGDTIPRPTSPVDGYLYNYADVQFMYSWRWTTVPQAFQDPAGTTVLFGLYIGVNQLHRLKATIDPATGAVALDVYFYDDGNQVTHYGRLTVVALCQRPRAVTAQVANDFYDLAEDLLGAGKVVRADVMSLLNRSLNYAACRPEVFNAEYAHGATVALPTSPVDGYAYSRDELLYFAEISRTDPETQIRILSYSIKVNQTTGVVDYTITRLREGGPAVITHDGKVRVWTIAMRGHVAHAITDPALLEGGGGGTEGDLVNGHFDVWSFGTSQQIADNWKPVSAAGTYAAQRQDPLDDGGGSAQQISCSSGAGNSIGVRTSKLQVRPGALRHIRFIYKGSVATTKGLFIRCWLFSADKLHSVYFDWKADGAIANTTQVAAFGMEVPQRNATTVKTSIGDLPLVGLYDYNAAWAFVDILLVEPNVATALVLDACTWKEQLNPADGEVTPRGSGALAFFPAIPYSVTGTTIDWDFTALPINYTDQTTRNISDGHKTNSGLTALTDYWYYPALEEATGLIKFVTTGGSGSTGISHTTTSRAKAVEWYQTGWLPLAGSPIKVTTLGVGGSGGGGGGGDSGCPSERMKVLEKTRGVIYCEFLIVGDYVWSVRAQKFLRVLAVRVDHWDEWALIEWANGTITETTLTGKWVDLEGDEVRTFDVGLATGVLSKISGGVRPKNIRPSNRMGKRVAITLEDDPHTFAIGLEEPDVDYHNNLPPPT